jgi:hypothetical protein
MGDEQKGKTVFKSEFLLTSEQIRALGVPEEHVSSYQRLHYNNSYAVETVTQKM